jgi:cephalosporin-C deacetylase-like acetyl esterase
MEPLNRFPTMMQDYMMARVRLTERVGEALKFGLRSKREALAYQDEVRDRIRRIIGPRPRRVPFNERLTGGFEREHYRVENLLFDTRPNFPVSANLYIPKGRPLPAPCVLGVCGHSFEGKGYDSYQAFAQGLATKGYVVLLFDPIGQGERLQYPTGKAPAAGEPHKSRYNGTVGDHIQCANHMTLVGEWFGSWRIWDGVRALDYLLSRPEADPRHVGLTGNSGGGTMTTWLVAADDRFTMAAPGCYVTTWRRNLENEIPADPEQDPPDALKYVLDADDFLFLHAPKPLILLTQELDFFDQRGSVEVYHRLRHLYRLLGHEDHIQLHTGSSWHGYDLPLREVMYGFFNRHCGKQREGARELPCQAEPQPTIWATQTGQVWDLGADNVPAFTARKADALAAKRKRLTGEPLRRELARLLGVVTGARLSRAARTPAAVESRAPVPDYRYLYYGPGDRQYPLQATYYSIETEPRIQVMLTMLDQQRMCSRIPQGGRETALYVPHLSSDEDLREEPLARNLAQRHGRYFAADVRGLGESRPNACGAGSFLQPYGSDFFFSYFSQMYGECYLGRRVHDLLRVLDVLESRGYRKIELAARGFGALPALFAAVLDKRIATVTLKHVPLSYHEMTQDEDYKWPLSSLVWGILKKLDLPDCFRALGKRLTILEPWDSRMQPIPARQAKKRLAELGIA